MAMMSRAIWTLLSSTRESPTSYPFAFRKVLAIPPPTRSTSALANKLSTTPILSEILAPPRMATKGRSGSATALPRKAISFSIKEPATAGRYLATPAVDACARWAVPKASLTYTSPSPASVLAKSGSLPSSSGWKRRFSKSTTSPGFIAATAASTSSPAQSSSFRTGTASNSLSRTATTFSRSPSTTFPLGRPI